MTGLELFDTIKNKWPNTPVILATGYAEPSGIQEVKMLVKPFAECELARAIASASAI